MKRFRTKWISVLYFLPIAAYFLVMSGCSGGSSGGGCGQQQGQTTCGAGTTATTDSQGNTVCAPNR